MNSARLVAVAVVACASLACEEQIIDQLSRAPDYDLTLQLAGRDGGGGVPETSLHTGKASLKTFTCDVSIRLGQCVDAMPIQLVFVPAAQAQSGSNNCGQLSASKILQANVGVDIPLGRGDGGLVWVQAFQGDDDDDSGLVDRREMNAYAELKHGSVNLTSFDGQEMRGTIDAQDADGGSFIRGTLGAVPNDSGGRTMVGPRCTWPIGAKAN